MWTLFGSCPRFGTRAKARDYVLAPILFEWSRSNSSQFKFKICELLASNNVTTARAGYVSDATVVDNPPGSWELHGIDDGTGFSDGSEAVGDRANLHAIDIRTGSTEKRKRHAN